MFRTGLILVFFSISVCHGLHLPNYIKACPINSPDFTACAIKSGNAAFPHLLKGDRAYGVPSFYPFKITFVSLATSGLEMNMTDATVTGIEKGRLVDFKVEPEKRRGYSKVGSPLIRFDFSYSIKGNIASLPIEGNGEGWFMIYNANYTYAYEFDITKKKENEHYMMITKDNVITEPENFECELTNLFNGNKQLGDHLNKFLNENWREILKEFDPVITKVFGTISKEILGKFFHRIPLEELYPGIVL